MIVFYSLACKIVPKSFNHIHQTEYFELKSNETSKVHVESAIFVQKITKLESKSFLKISDRLTIK